MSKKNFQTLLNILRQFKFKFEFSAPEWLNDATNKKMILESGLTVNYGPDKGSFKVMVSTFENEELSQLYNLLESENRISGTIPDELKKQLQPVVEKTKQFNVTKELLYYRPETWRIESGEVIEIDGRKKAYRIKQDQLPQYEFAFFGKPTQKHPGICLIDNGFLISISTPEWKQDVKQDPFALFVKKVNEVGPDAMKKMLSQALKVHLENEEKWMKNNDEVVPSDPKVKPIEPKVPTTQEEASKAVEKLIAALKGDDEDVFFSWGIEDIETDVRIDTSDIANPFVEFEVAGFLYEGLVRVTYNTAQKTATISMIDQEQEDPVLIEIDGLKLSQVQTSIDRMIEYDGDAEEYLELVKSTYPEDHKQLQVAA